MFAESVSFSKSAGVELQTPLAQGHKPAASEGKKLVCQRSFYACRRKTGAFRFSWV
jgi:hypothetical protein